MEEEQKKEEGQEEETEASVMAEVSAFADPLRALDADGFRAAMSAGTPANETYFDTRPLGELSVRGKAEPIRAWTVEAAREGRTRLEAGVQRGLTPLVEEHSAALVADLPPDGVRVAPAAAVVDCRLSPAAAFCCGCRGSSSAAATASACQGAPDAAAARCGSRSASR